MNEIFEKNKHWLKDFEKSFNEDTEVREKFKDIFNRLVEQKHITAVEFEDKVHLNEKTFRRWKNGEKEPKMKNFVTFCIVYEIDYALANDMMNTLEISFILTNRVHFAYYNLMKNFKYCIEDEKLIECNKLLDRLSIDKVYWLGNDYDKCWKEDK